MCVVTIEMSVLANGTENVQISRHSSLQKCAEMSSSDLNPLEKLNWLIHLKHVRGETAQCKEIIKKEIMKSNGNNEFAYFKQGFIFREENQLQEALESFQICMKLNPNNPENMKEVGNCLYEKRRYRLALEAFLEAEKTSTTSDWQIYYNIGRCLLKLGETTKSKEYAQKAVQMGKNEDAYTLYMKILVSEGDIKSAVSICNVAIESCPDSVSMLTEAGLLYLKMGKMQYAFEKLSSALALNSVCARALLGVGCITQSHEEYDVALTKYKVAVSNEPNSVALWNNIGMCFYSKQKHIAAVSCLKRALWLSPTNWKVLFNLGLVHLATYQPASAFNFLCAAVNLRPDFPNSFIGLGCALFELKDSGNAGRAFKQALALAPNDPLVIINNIVCLLILENKAEARELFEKFIYLTKQDEVVPKEILSAGNHLTQYFADVPETDANQEAAQYLNDVGGNVEIAKNNHQSSPRELESDEV